MIRFGLIFLSLSLICGLLGFNIVPGLSFEIARFFFYILAGLGVLLVIAGLAVWKEAS